ncbi:hypothetical protein [Mesorhizobium sp.]|uniref:hypothetical protein n=1 Tax=Mesorhizobium sp. TaxID=1871066 RepID=UPI001228C8A2|nr:hypothetical protein [Mesorhizobium sp.]TIQ79903.1 MAG: hypothetical protein E5X39_12990 [Mesorhizobium sp.]
MPPQISVPRLKAGVRQRLIVIEALLANRAKRFSRRPRQSLALSVLSSTFLNAETELFQQQTKTLRAYLNFSYTYRQYSVKISLTDLIKDHPYYPILRNLSVGDTFLYGEHSNHIYLSPTDYSLFYRQEGQPLSDELCSCIRECFAEFFRRHSLPFESSYHVLKSYAHIAQDSRLVPARRPKPDPRPHSIAEIRRSLQVMIRHLWPLTGGYVPHSLMRLCDPEDTLERTNDLILRTEASSLLLERTLHSLFLLRLINAHRYVEISHAESHISSLFGKRTNISRKVIAYCNSDWRIAREIKVSGKDTLAKAISHTINIYCCMHIMKERREIYKEIEMLHAADSVAVQFLNWGVIADYIKRFPAENTPLSIFVSILMTDPVVARRFPIKVGLAVGSGRVNRQIFSLASELFKSQSARHINGFLKHFLPLKGAARDIVFAYLADRSVSDRLYSLFQADVEAPVKGEGNNGSKDEKYVAQTRIAIITFLIARVKDGKAQLFKALEDERSFLRSLYFREIYGLGRVLINEFELIFEMEMLFDEYFNIASIKERREAVFRRHLADVMADNVVQHGLFQSDFSLNAVLSNNLRHGVIEPRIVNAIDLACRSQADYDLIAPLRTSIEHSVQRYMNEWLKITADGPTVRNLRETMSASFDKLLSKSTVVDVESLSDAAIEEIKKVARSVVDNGLIAFDSQLVAEVERSCEVFFESRSTSVALRERIVSSLAASFEDVKSWIGIPNLKGAIESFSLRDLADFELRLLRPNMQVDRRDVRVEYNDGETSRHEADIRISGVYFEAVVSIIHNLFANAVKYSGLGRRTRVQLVCHMRPGAMIFRVENDIAETISDQELHRLWQKASEQAKVDFRKDTFREGGTGIKKVRRMCTRDFGACRVNIPVPGRRRQFIVEVTLTGTLVGLST